MKTTSTTALRPSRSSRHSTELPSRHSTPMVGSPSMRRSPTAPPSPGNLTSEDIAAIKFATEFHVHTLGLADLPGLPNNQLWFKWWQGKRYETRREESQLSLLAWAYSTMTFVHPSSARDRVVKGLEYRGAALSALQKLMKSLKSQGDYAAALDCTLYLGCFEWQQGLINETVAHFKAAKSFLDSLGGLKALPPQSQETLLWIFTNVSFTFPIRPLIKVSELGSGSRHGGEVESMSRMSLDDRKPNNTVDQLIGSRLSGMLEQTNNLLDDLADLAKVSSTTEKVKGFHSLYMQKLGLQVQLAHLWHDTLDASPAKDRHRSSPPGSSNTSLRSAFTLLLRLFAKISTETFTSMIPWKSYFVPWHDKILDRLRPLQCEIMTSTSKSSRPDREQKAKELLLLWMFFIGACIEQQFIINGARDAGQSDRTMFCSSQFTKLAAHMSYHRAGDVAADLAKYVAFSNGKQGQILKKLMQPLEHGSDNGRRRER